MKWKLVSVIILFFFVSCEIDVGIPDYRDEYTGTYNCTRYYYSHIYMQSPNYDTTAITVLVTKDYSSKSKIIINGDTVEISESGTFSEGNYSNNYFVRFRNDSIYTKYSYNYMGGSGSRTIRGVKSN